MSDAPAEARKTNAAAKNSVGTAATSRRSWTIPASRRLLSAIAVIAGAVLAFFHIGEGAPGSPARQAHAEDGPMMGGRMHRGRQRRHMRQWNKRLPREPSAAWSLAYGGRLYDNWAATLRKSAPQRTHPLYPKAGKKTGSATWRCKECHGWDTNGAKGAYAKGSHFTGINGLRAMRGKKPETIARTIRGPGHRFTKAMIPDTALKRLAEYVSAGQVETERYIDYTNGTARGDAGRGKAFFENVCAVCHGFDGRALNFHDKGDPEFVGTVARKAPWELMHKLINGQPGERMPAFGVLPRQSLADIIAYSQTLPAK